MHLINNELHDDFILPNEVICPVCKCKMDAALETNGSTAPSHDDFAICAGCGEILNYVIAPNKLSLRITTDKDIEIAKNQGLFERLLHYQNFIRNTPHGLNVK